MENKLQFEVQEDFGCFVYPDERFAPLLDEFDDLLDARQSGEMNDKHYIAELNRLIRQESDFIDLHAHLSFAFLEQDKPKKHWMLPWPGWRLVTGLSQKVFQALLNGDMWIIARIFAPCRGPCWRMCAYDAIKMLPRLLIIMLAYNPNDNQGSCYLLGSEVLRAGNKERAANIFDEYADNYPPYYYELALLHILNKDWVKAATALRLGFSPNSYIAEMLCGNFHPQPLAIWHGSNFAEPEMATDYIEMYGELWFCHPEALAFARWLFNHSSIMTERASLIKCTEDLFSERDFGARRHIIDHQQRLLNGIDHRLSTEIVKKVKNRQGQEIWPWMHAFGWPVV